MSKMIAQTWAILLLCFVGNAALHAQNEGNQSLLWKVTGPDLTTPSYLYGTIHVIGSEDFFWANGLKGAFSETESLMLELDMDNPLEMMGMFTKGMMEDGQTLKDLLAPEAYTVVNAYMTDSLQLPEMLVSQMQKMQPILAASVFYPKMLNGEMASYEAELMKMAKADGKEINGLETVDEQLSAVGNIPYAKQAEMLSEFVVNYDAQKEQIAELIERYIAQDLEGVYTLTAESGELSEFRDAMLDQRNRNWIPTLKEAMQQAPVFVAVGAGHLAGEQGVIALLKADGYTVEPVK